jgi:hypothetical protein
LVISKYTFKILVYGSWSSLLKWQRKLHIFILYKIICIYKKLKIISLCITLCNYYFFLRILNIYFLQDFQICSNLLGKVIRLYNRDWIYLSHLNEILSSLTNIYHWMKLGDIMFNEIHHTQKEILYDLIYMWNLKKMN